MINIINIKEDNQNKETKEAIIYANDHSEDRNTETVKDLLDTINDYQDYSTQHNQLEEYLNSKVLLELVDANGNIVSGDMFLSVGWCGDRLVLTGSVDKINLA